MSRHCALLISGAPTPPHQHLPHTTPRMDRGRGPNFARKTRSLIHLESTLTRQSASVDSKLLTASLSYLDATLTKNRGWGSSDPTRVRTLSDRRESKGLPCDSSNSRV